MSSFKAQQGVVNTLTFIHLNAIEIIKTRVVLPFPPRLQPQSLVMAALSTAASPAPALESASLVQKRKLSDVAVDTKMMGTSPEKENVASADPTVLDPRMPQLINDVFIVLQRCAIILGHVLDWQREVTILMFSLQTRYESIDTQLSSFRFETRRRAVE